MSDHPDDEPQFATGGVVRGPVFWADPDRHADGCIIPPRRPRPRAGQRVIAEAIAEAYIPLRRTTDPRRSQ